MDEEDEDSAKRRRDSISVGAPFARFRVIAVIILLAVALVVVLLRSIAG